MFEAAANEFKNSQRLRLGVAIIVAVLWCYGLLLLRDAQLASAQAYRTAAVKLARLQSIPQEGDWSKRLTDAKLLQSGVESRLWRGDTIGLANAAVQDFLNQQLQAVGATRATVIMVNTGDETKNDDKPTGVATDLWKVKAKLVFDFNSVSFNKLFRQFASHTSGVVVESVTVIKEPVARVEAVVVAYFQKPSSAVVTGK